MMAVEAQCRVCGQASTSARCFDAREMMVTVHRYFQCDTCGCLQIVDMPPDMASYYGADYYSMGAPEEVGFKAFLLGLRNRHAALQQGLLGGWLLRLKPTTEFDFLQPLRAHLNEHSRLLDVGCGSGHLLRRLQTAGFDRLLGVDPFIDADVSLNGRRLVVKDMLKEVAGPFELIMFNHSLEHMPEQLDAMRSAFDLLVPGGHCLVRVPLVTSQAWDRYGVNWVQLDAPRHFYLHSNTSLRQLGEQAGFRCVAERYDSTALQFWGSEQYAMDIPLRDPRSFAEDPGAGLFTVQQIAEFEAEAVRLNTAGRGDQAGFYFQKPATV